MTAEPILALRTSLARVKLFYPIPPGTPGYEGGSGSNFEVALWDAISDGAIANLRFVCVISGHGIALRLWLGNKA